jgi:hypothetical protein
MREATFSEYAKKTLAAIVGAVATALATGLGVLLAAYSDGSDGGSLVTTPEKIKVTIAFLVTLAGGLGTAYGVYQVQNAPLPPQLQKDVR